MASRLHRLVAVTLAALLMVAATVGAAHAVSHGTDVDCTVCVLSHHAPAVTASAAPVPTPLQSFETITIVVSEPTLPSMRVTRSGRAPPRTLSPSPLRDA